MLLQMAGFILFIAEYSILYVHNLFELVFSFSSDKYPGVELLDHMLVLF